MPGILEALTSCGFTCYEPSNASRGTEVENDTDNRPVYREFEKPRTKREQLPVEDLPPEAPSIFRYFVDGSMRTTNAGYIVDAYRQFWPIFIAQIGVAATTLNDQRVGLETHSAKTILFLPGTTNKADEREARKRVRDAAATSRMPLELKARAVLRQRRREADRGGPEEDHHDDARDGNRAHQESGGVGEGHQRGDAHD